MNVHNVYKISNLFFQSNSLEINFRILWVIVVVTSIAFFTVMVGIRTSEYMKHETNIAMELTFADHVPFPAVTLCNQNAFRMTKAIELGLYTFIDGIYSADDIASKLLGKTVPISLNYSLLLL